VSSELLGKSALITGGANGIGRATAELFAAEGARIVAADIDEPGLNRLREDLDSRGAVLAVVVGDVPKPEDARRMVGTADQYGRLDVLVANAGVIPLRNIVEAAGQSTYGPAKFAASGLTKHLAVEWADRGIRVNAVAPGTIKTERVRRLPDEPGGREYIEEIERLHPMGRLGEPAEVAEAIAFLASDRASFITGAILPVDGGYLAR
jgi:NAD(P)-dependent dehydrogenase (short-subunit alcohol dehydrogenase family)